MGTAHKRYVRSVYETVNEPVHETLHDLGIAIPDVPIKAIPVGRTIADKAVVGCFQMGIGRVDLFFNADELKHRKIDPVNLADTQAHELAHAAYDQFARRTRGVTDRIGDAIVDEGIATIVGVIAGDTAQGVRYDNFWDYAADLELLRSDAANIAPILDYRMADNPWADDLIYDTSTLGDRNASISAAVGLGIAEVYRLYNDGCSMTEIACMPYTEVLRIAE